MPVDFQKYMHDLADLCGTHLGDTARENLRSLPIGWLNIVRAMLNRVEQVLGDPEQTAFRWTTLARQKDRLVVCWSGAMDSGDLVDQIVEEALEETSNTCIDCGAGAMVGIGDLEGPRCLFHAMRRPARGNIKDWNIFALQLVGALEGRFGSTMPPRFHPKTIAAALPLLVREAGGYFSNPDKDAQSIIRQLQEALLCLDQQIRAHTNSRLELR